MQKSRVRGSTSYMRKIYTQILTKIETEINKMQIFLLFIFTNVLFFHKVSEASRATDNYNSLTHSLSIEKGLREGNFCFSLLMSQESVSMTVIY